MSEIVPPGEPNVGGGKASSNSSGEESEDEKKKRIGSGAPSKKIKFKRAKKLKKFHKAVGANYMKHYNDLNRSRFEDWTKSELVQLLIEHGFELRNEQHLELISLRDLTESLYLKKPMPVKPKIMTVMELAVATILIRRIQNKWIDYTVRKRHADEEQASLDYIRRLSNNEFNEFEEIGSLDIEALGREDSEGLEVIMDDAMGTEDDGLQMMQKEPSIASSKKKKKARMNVLDMQWTAPSWPKAEIYQDHVQPRRGGKGGQKYDFYNTTTGRHCCLGGLGEQFDLWEEGQISQFSLYGVGITNYFKFLKWAAWIFLLIAIVTLPTLVLNIYGPNEANNGLQVLAKTTVGNLVNPLNSMGNSTQDTQMNGHTEVFIPGCSTYGLYNIDCTLNPDQLGKFYMVTDLAVVLVLIIGYLWLIHFENFEEKVLVNKNTVNASMFTIKVSNLPKNTDEDSVSIHFKKLFKNNPEYSVAAVSLAFNNLHEINECKIRGDIIKRKVRLVHEHRYYCTTLENSGSPEKVIDEKIQKSRKVLMADIKKVDEALTEREANLEKFAEEDPDAIYAFVTFNKVEGKVAALRAYNKASFFSGPDPDLKLGENLLYLSEAAEPSTIIWEHLTFSWTERKLRRCATFFVSLCFIMLSVVMVFGAKYFEETSLSGNSYQEVCPVGFEDQTVEYQEQYVEDNPELLFCYCDQYNLIEQASESICQDFLRDTIYTQVFLYISSLVVVIVNVILEQVMKYCANFEKHHTHDGQARSIFTRLFVLKYLNTATVFFIDGNNTIMKAVFGLDVGSAQEFTAEWFNTVGVTIILVQLADIFFANSDTLFAWWYYERRIRLAKKPSTQPLTQDELNKLHEGKDFEISYKYAQVMATTFVCLTFALGIPLLYFIAAVNLIVFYFAEKYFFCNLYSIPPHFNALLGKSVSRVIPWAFIIHLCMSIWIISSQEIFLNEQITTQNLDQAPVVLSSDFRSRLTGQNTYPLTILLALLVLYEASLWFVGTSHLAHKCWDRLSSSTEGGVEDRDSGNVSAMYTTYTRAVERNIIKSLYTYHILQNPVYKDAFAITWKFALNNKDVRSVRKLKGKAQEEDLENDLQRVHSLQRKNVTEEARGHNRLRVSTNRSFFSSIEPVSPQKKKKMTPPEPPTRDNARDNTRDRDPQANHNQRIQHMQREAQPKASASSSSRSYQLAKGSSRDEDQPVRYEMIRRGDENDPML